MSDKSTDLRHGERIAVVEQAVTSLEERVDRFEQTCVRIQGEIKDMIDKALTNEYHEVKKEILSLKKKMEQNGIPVKISFWDRVKDPSIILNAVISGMVAIVVTWMYVTFG